MIVLGFDAGVRAGFAVIDVRRIGVAKHIASGRLPKGPERLGVAGELARRHAPELVVVELPKGGLYRYVPPSAVGAIVEATSIGGELHGYFVAKGFATTMITANDWRSALGCRGKAGAKADHRVEHMIRTRIPDWPKVSRVDARDAGGAALFAGLRWQSPANASPIGMSIKAMR